MSLNLPVVDGLTIGVPHRSLLMPGALLRDSRGRSRRLPRFFYSVDSWNTALETRLSPHFALWEFMDVDLHEPLPLRTFPRYVPCAVTALAAHLEVFRMEVGQPVKISSNGGYRSPAHARSRRESVHSWGTAANIYRIGDEYLDEPEKIERYGTLAMSLLPGLRARRAGSEHGSTDDHLHLDLGYLLAVPAEAPAEES